MMFNCAGLLKSNWIIYNDASATGWFLLVEADFSILEVKMFLKKFFFLLIFVCGFSSAWSEEGRSLDAKEAKQIFVDPSSQLGKKIIVRGFLHYVFENRNLFPENMEDPEEGRDYCLPFLIKRKDKELIALATSLHKSLVVVTGVIVSTENLVPVCRDFGIQVEEVRFVK